MKSHEELSSMSEDALFEYLHTEVETIINAASPKDVLKLRAIQAKMDGIRKRVKNPLVSASIMYQEMFDSLYKLKDHLK